MGVQTAYDQSRLAEKITNQTAKLEKFKKLLSNRQIGMKERNFPEINNFRSRSSKYQKNLFI